MTAQPASRTLFEPGTLIAGKYRIVSLIGMGGVGRVYLARHIELETNVAIKVLRPEMVDRADMVQRFGREARASVRLHSERIVRVLDVGNHEGKPYFVMEYMVGCNLLEARQQADIDIATLCEFFIQACEGLADAHAQGVVHRDVKPENLFVARDASGWRSLKIFDFGISKFSLTGKYSDVDLAAMHTEAMMGTPHYISPEQIRSTHDVDHRTDIWSLGAVMFEVLSGGILPFREEREVTALVAEVLERPHRSLLDVAPNVPERLAAIIDRCLAKDRTQRYQTVAEVALDLLPLAPARARAAVERAVSVMQAAGLMALNGDMESLRAPHIPEAERTPSYAPPNAAPSDSQAPAPPSGLRPSDPRRAPAAFASSPPPPFASSPPPFASSPSSPSSASWPPPAPFGARKRGRNAVLVLALAALLLAAVVVLAMRESPERGVAARPSVTQGRSPVPDTPRALPPVAQAEALPAARASEAPPAASASAPAPTRKPPAKVIWSPPHALAKPAPAPSPAKTTALKSADPPSPTTRPELRRER